MSDRGAPSAPTPSLPRPLSLWVAVRVRAADGRGAGTFERGADFAVLLAGQAVLSSATPSEERSGERPSRGRPARASLPTAGLDRRRARPRGLPGQAGAGPLLLSQGRHLRLHG